jgi:hypothetical protein
MLNRPSVLAIAALVALAAGIALSFFELIILGIGLAIAAIVVHVRSRRDGAEAATLGRR